MSKPARRKIVFIRSLIDSMPPMLARSIYALRRNSIRFKGPYRSWDAAAAKCTGYDADNILPKVLEAALTVKRGEAAFERDSSLFADVDYPWPVTAGIMWSAAQAGGKLNVLDFGGSLGSSYFQHARLLSALVDVRWNIIEQPHYTRAGRSVLQDEQLRFYDSIGECLSESTPNVVLISSVLQYLADPEQVIAEIRASGASVVIVDKTIVSKSANDRIYAQHVPASIYRANYPCRSLSESALIANFGPTYRLECDFYSADAPPVVQIGSEFKGFLFITTAQHGGAQ